MDIKINPEDVEQFVKEALVKSGVGKAVETAIAKVLNPNSYNNPVEEELRKYIKGIIEELLQQKFGATIREAIDAYLEKELTQDLVNKMTDTAVRKMIEAVKEY